VFDTIVVAIVVLVILDVVCRSGGPMAVCASGSGHVEVMVRGRGHIVVVVVGRYGGVVVWWC
jgi:hypothetical protein